MDISRPEKIPSRRSLLLTKSPRSFLELNPPEPIAPPKDNLLHVYMGNAHLLLPNTQEYVQFDGIETGALASCTGIALYLPQEDGAILGVAHLKPSQGVFSVRTQIDEQLREAGIDAGKFYGGQGYMSVISGQASYDKWQGRLREGVDANERLLREMFPNYKTFPIKNTSYSVLSGHISSSVELFKDGRLVVAGEGKSY